MNTKRWHITGTLFIWVIGVLCHFAKDFLPGVELIRYLCPVNESVWEHLKLLFWPAILWSVAEYFAYGRAEADFCAVKMTAISLGMIFAVSFFYTYSGVLGFNVMFMDIACFLMAVVVCQYVSFRLFSDFKAGSCADGIKGAIVLLLYATAFVVWTDTPPDIGIFW